MERHLSADVSHVVLHRRNRALVDGRTSRVRHSAFVIVVLPLLTAVSVLMIFVSISSGLGAWAVVVVLCSLFYGWLGLSAVRIRAAMNRSARLVTGTVTRVEQRTVPTYPAGGASEYSVHYRFPTQSGEDKPGVERLHGMYFRRVPRVGEHVAVVYLETVYLRGRPGRGPVARMATRYLERHRPVRGPAEGGVTSRGVAQVM